MNTASGWKIKIITEAKNGVKTSVVKSQKAKKSRSLSKLTRMKRNKTSDKNKHRAKKTVFFVRVGSFNFFRKRSLIAFMDSAKYKIRIADGKREYIEKR